MDAKKFTPKKIVEELDRYIIGQDKAKRAVAVALRNRYRRTLLSDAEREEFTPKNIIMIGPTGVGKTEIARRISKLVTAPFIKVEATKFTEVGYVGRDVESMIRDLVTTSIRMVQQQKLDEVSVEAEKRANALIVEALVPGIKKKVKNAVQNPFDMLMNVTGQSAPQSPPPSAEEQSQIQKNKAAVEKQLAEGKLEDREVEIEVVEENKKPIGFMGAMGDDMNINMQDIFGDLLPQKTKVKRVKIKDARRILANQEAQKLIDMDEVEELGRKEAEQNGIIFIDEIDKIIGGGGGSGPDVSREGVQRDILPIVEGSTVNTKYGPVKTDYILFIGAGAFHISKIEDMIPELQGRFPIHVQLESLSQENFTQILKTSENSAIRQYTALLKTEGVELIFDDEAIDELAAIAFSINEEDENIGARRLHTVLEELLEEISFYASDYDAGEFHINKAYVDSVFNREEKEKSYMRFLL